MLQVQIPGTPLAVWQPKAPERVELILLPSEDLERARPRISLSNFVVHPGSKLETLMRSAAFRATEHKYDL